MAHDDFKALPLLFGIIDYKRMPESDYALIAETPLAGLPFSAHFVADIKFETDIIIASNHIYFSALSCRMEIQAVVFMTKIEWHDIWLIIKA